MPNIHSMVSTSMGLTLEVRVYHTKIAKRLKVGVVHEDFYVVLSEDLFGNQFNHIHHHLDEFVVTSVGEMRPLIKEVKATGVFIDTGKRVQFNTNLWGEVWRLRPEHFTLLQEKEKKDEQAPSEHDLNC